MVSVILLTGFKPYSTFKRNSSGEIAELLDGSYFKGKEVKGISLDVKHSSIRRIYSEELKKRYDLIVNTGLTPGKNVVSLEKIAINWQDDSKDEEGISPKTGKIVPDGPDGLFARIPVEEVVHKLRSAKIPSQVSFSPGISLCNKIFYYSLYYSKAKSGFINFPLEDGSSLDGKYPTMVIDKMIRAVELSIQKMI